MSDDVVVLEGDGQGGGWKNSSRSPPYGTVTYTWADIVLRPDTTYPQYCGYLPPLAIWLRCPRGRYPRGFDCKIFARSPPSGAVATP